MNKDIMRIKGNKEAITKIQGMFITGEGKEIDIDTFKKTETEITFETMNRNIPIIINLLEAVTLKENTKLETRTNYNHDAYDKIYTHNIEFGKTNLKNIEMNFSYCGIPEELSQEIKDRIYNAAATKYKDLFKMNLIEGEVISPDENLPHRIGVIYNYDFDINNYRIQSRLQCTNITFNVYKKPIYK